MGFWAFGASFRRTQWVTCRAFALEGRRQLSSRERAIRSQIERIGEVNLFWNKDEAGHATNQRRLLSVSSNQSAIGKLMLAYVSLGGNPFDISMFLNPRTGLSTKDELIVRNQPGGGLVSLETGTFAWGPFDASKPQQGDSTVDLYKWGRKGGPSAPEDPGDVTTMHRLRAPYKQELAYRFTDLERRILKQCDLVEQLQEELEWLSQAGGQATAVGNLPFSEVLFDPTATTAQLVARMDSIFFTMDEDDSTNIVTANEDSVNTEGLAFHPTLLDDADGEGDNSL